MNYTSAAVGVVMLISLVTWVTTGRKQFTGPKSGGVVLDDKGGVEARGLDEGEGAREREKGAEGAVGRADV
jgi:hypothetical protein